MSLKTGKTRTQTQNASLHLFLTMLSNALNKAGIDCRSFFKDGYEMPFTPEIAKEHIWKPIQKALTGESSTTKPTRADYGKIYDVLNLKLIEHGIYVAWPIKEDKK